MRIEHIGKNFVKSMSVKKFSYLGQFILGLRRSEVIAFKENLLIKFTTNYAFVKVKS